MSVMEAYLLTTTTALVGAVLAIAVTVRENRRMLREHAREIACLQKSTR